MYIILPETFIIDHICIVVDGRGVEGHTSSRQLVKIAHPPRAVLTTIVEIGRARPMRM